MPPGYKELEDADFYMNLVGLVIYVICFAGVLYLRKCKIDLPAIIICTAYPIGIIAQICWRIWDFGIPKGLEVCIIILHDFTIVLPSYFVYEMESIRLILNAKNLEHF